MELALINIYISLSPFRRDKGDFNDHARFIRNYFFNLMTIPNSTRFYKYGKKEIHSLKTPSYFICFYLSYLKIATLFLH